MAMKWWLMAHVRLRGVYATTQGVMPLPGHRANHWVVCNAWATWVQKYWMVIQSKHLVLLINNDKNMSNQLFKTWICILKLRIFSCQGWTTETTGGYNQSNQHSDCEITLFSMFDGVKPQCFDGKIGSIWLNEVATSQPHPNAQPRQQVSKGLACRVTPGLIMKERSNMGSCWDSRIHSSPSKFEILSGNGDVYI